MDLEDCKSGVIVRTFIFKSLQGCFDIGAFDTLRELLMTFLMVQACHGVTSINFLSSSIVAHQVSVILEYLHYD